MSDEHPDRTFHVYPLHGPEHRTDGEPCWCEPRREELPDTDGAVLVIHNEPPN